LTGTAKCILPNLREILIRMDNRIRNTREDAHALEDKVARHDAVLLGNGKEGLVTQIARIWDRTRLLLWVGSVTAAAAIGGVVLQALS